jgi:hypothetical protein
VSYLACSNLIPRVIDSASVAPEEDRYSNPEGVLVGEAPWCLGLGLVAIARRVGS